jgi:hypothetical protein
MKKILLSLLMALIFKASVGQNYNPAVWAPSISPAPIVNAGGTATFGFNIGNLGNDPMTLHAGDNLVIIISLSQGVPNNADPIAALGGTFKSKFNWIYDAVSKSYLGTQNQTINGVGNGGVGDLTIAYKITQSSVQQSPQNGFNVNLTPPLYTIGINAPGDDAVSAYTYGTAGTLPVSLASFNAVVNNCVTNLYWKSATELNFRNYEVQYSKDGVNFETIAVVNGQGDNVSYSKVHNPAQGKAYYRLKSVDNDSRSSYSQVIALNINCSKGSVLVYPNPARDVLNVSITGADAKGTMSTLFNVAGQSVLSKNLSNGSHQLDISNLSRGVYQLRLVNNAGTDNIKVLID